MDDHMQIVSIIVIQIILIVLIPLFMNLQRQVSLGPSLITSHLVPGSKPFLQSSLPIFFATTKMNYIYIHVSCYLTYSLL